MSEVGMRGVRRMRRSRRDALAGSGPIVNRARHALRRVASQFGTRFDTEHTYVRVSTAAGFDLDLRYDPGDYLLSRVYNLRVSMVLPADSPIPNGVRLRHGARTSFAAAKDSSVCEEHLGALDRRFGPRLDTIDVISAETRTAERGVEFSLVPMGGSFVWVLIPPIFKATAFPVGETERILALFADLHRLTTARA